MAQDKQDSEHILTQTENFASIGTSANSSRIVSQTPHLSTVQSSLPPALQPLFQAVLQSAELPKSLQSTPDKQTHKSSAENVSNSSKTQCEPQPNAAALLSKDTSISKASYIAAVKSALPPELGPLLASVLKSTGSSNETQPSKLQKALTPEFTPKDISKKFRTPDTGAKHEADLNVQLIKQQELSKNVLSSPNDTEKQGKDTEALSSRLRAVADQAVEEKSLEVLRPRRKKVRNVLTRIEELEPGPLYLLKQAMLDKRRVKVWIRSAVHIRSICTGYLLLFDKHMNLALSDVDEIYRNPLLRYTRERFKMKKKKKKKRLALNNLIQAPAIDDQPNYTNEPYSRDTEAIMITDAPVPPPNPLNIHELTGIPSLFEMQYPHQTVERPTSGYGQMYPDSSHETYPNPAGYRSQTGMGRQDDSSWKAHQVAQQIDPALNLDGCYDGSSHSDDGSNDEENLENLSERLDILKQQLADCSDDSTEEFSALEKELFCYDASSSVQKSSQQDGQSEECLLVTPSTSQSGNSININQNKDGGLLADKKELGESGSGKNGEKNGSSSKKSSSSQKKKQSPLKISSMFDSITHFSHTAKTQDHEKSKISPSTSKRDGGKIKDTGSQVSSTSHHKTKSIKSVASSHSTCSTHKETLENSSKEKYSKDTRKSHSKGNVNSDSKEIGRKDTSLSVGKSSKKDDSQAESSRRLSRESEKRSKDLKTHRYERVEESQSRHHTDNSGKYASESRSSTSSIDLRQKLLRRSFRYSRQDERESLQSKLDASRSKNVTKERRSSQSSGDKYTSDSDHDHSKRGTHRSRSSDHEQTKRDTHRTHSSDNEQTQRESRRTPDSDNERSKRVPHRTRTSDNYPIRDRHRTHESDGKTEPSHSSKRQGHSSVCEKSGRESRTEKDDKQSKYDCHSGQEIRYKSSDVPKSKICLSKQDIPESASLQSRRSDRQNKENIFAKHDNNNESRKPLQEILRRHVNQLFIRGDNVVLVAFAD